MTETRQLKLSRFWVGGRPGRKSHQIPIVWGRIFDALRHGNYLGLLSIGLSAIADCGSSAILTMVPQSALSALLFLVPFAWSDASDYRPECPSQDVDRAIRGCTIAIQTATTPAPVAYANRCIALWLKGSYAPAIADCDQSIKQGSASPTAYLIRGVGLAENGELHAAIADYSRSLDLSATATAFYNRGTAYLALGDFGAALADFDKAIEAQPSVPQAHVNRGLALLSTGQTSVAFAELERGLVELRGNGLAWSIRQKAMADVDHRDPNPGSFDAVSTHPLVQYFPASKVLPVSLSLDAFVADNERLPELSRRGPQKDSFADCLRLWQPDTQTSLRQWQGICRRLDFPSANDKRSR
jgi:tetratricopeptide (TPR) repeat protein